MTLLTCALLFGGLARANGEEVHVDKPKGYAIGASAGVATGVGASVRLPLGEKSRLMVTVSPVYTRDSSFFSGGLRYQRYIAYFDHVRFHSVLAVGSYSTESQWLRAAGIGFGMETGGEYRRGFTWWGDLAYTAVFDNDGLAMIAPLPQMGIMVAF